MRTRASGTPTARCTRIRSRVPGFTWTPGGPEVGPPRGARPHRLGARRRPLRGAVASDLVGERGGPDVDIAVDPYPSDHRGVASTFVVRPGEPPAFAAPETRRLSIGDALSVVFHAPGRAGERVAIARVGGESGGRAADLGRGRHADVLDDAARGAVPTRSCCSTSAAQLALARARSGSTGPASRTKVWTSEAGLREGRADRRLLVERARDALGLAGRLPRQAGQQDPLRDAGVQRRLLRQRRLPCSTSTRRRRSRARRRSPVTSAGGGAPGRCGRACTRCGCSSTTATARGAKSPRFRVARRSAD